MNKYSLKNIFLLIFSYIIITSQFTYFNQNNLSSNSEFFAYSWIYGVRWGLGDFIFQPHSQLLYPIYSLVNTFFNLSDGDMSSIIDKWYQVSFYWPFVVLYFSLIIFYTSSDSENISIKILIFTLIFVVLFSFGLGGAVLSSLSYHTLSIPIGLISLYFYNFYIHEKSIKKVNYYYTLLGLYSSICVLAKPTFIAFVIPIYIIEISLMFIYKNGRIYTYIINSIFIAILTYFLYLCWFYGDIKSLFKHFYMTASFIYNQSSYYSENKGIAFPGYLISQLGWSWIILISICFMLSIYLKRYLNLIAIFSGLFVGLFFLHGRPNSHAFPEFLTLILSLVVFSIHSFENYLIISKKIELIIIAVCASFLFYFYPIKFGEKQFISEMNDVDKQIIPIILNNKNPILIAVMYPQVFWGSVDAWCRGSKNIMDTSHSNFFDNKFNKNTCIVDGEYPAFNPNLYEKIYSIRKMDERVDLFINRFNEKFPMTSKNIVNCNDIDKLKNTSFKGVIVECELKIK